MNRLTPQNMAPTLSGRGIQSDSRLPTEITCNWKAQMQKTRQRLNTTIWNITSKVTNEMFYSIQSFSLFSIGQPSHFFWKLTVAQSSANLLAKGTDFANHNFQYYCNRNKMLACTVMISNIYLPISVISIDNTDQLYWQILDI